MSGYSIISLYGLGDTYLIAALCAAFKYHHCRDGEQLTLIVKESHRDLALLFSGYDHLETWPDHKVATYAAQEAGYHHELLPGMLFPAHPSTVLIRGDDCVRFGRMTDAAMYAMILGVPTDAPLSLPVIPPSVRDEARAIAQELDVDLRHTAILFPGANSSPPPPDHTWHQLKFDLAHAGWKVIVNDLEKIPLRTVIPLCEIAGWAIGTTCGLMQMLISSRAQCRKTILAYTIPYPYAYHRKTDGLDYDIEEYRVTGDPTHDQHVINLVAYGRNARGEIPSPNPMMLIDVPTPPGEIIDRLSILYVKQQRTNAMLYPDIARLSEFRDRLVARFPEIAELEHQLRAVTIEGWDAHNGASVETILGINRRRIAIKNQINAVCNVSFREEKSY